MYYINKQDYADARSYSSHVSRQTLSRQTQSDHTVNTTHMKEVLSTKNCGKNTKKLLLLHGYGVAAFSSRNFSCHRNTYVGAENLRAAALHTHKRGYFMKEDLHTMLTHEEQQKQKQAHNIRRLQRIACYRGIIIRRQARG